jgi:hypothetical protein
MSLLERLRELKAAVEEGLVSADAAEECKRAELRRWLERGDGKRGSSIRTQKSACE